MEETDNHVFLKQLSNHYDKVYVINIERTRKLRLEKVKQNLKGLPFEFFEGVDGSLLSDEELNQIADLEESRERLNTFYMHRYGHPSTRTLKKSEIGVSYSHIKIYREMVANGWRKVLIFEDDARIDFSKTHLIPEILREIPADCELFFWGYRWYDCETTLRRFFRLYITTPFEKSKAFLSRTSYENLIERYPKPYKKHVWHAGLHAGTHGYAITLQGAKKMLSGNFPVVMTSDRAVSYLQERGELKCYVAVPLIVRDDQTVPSSII